MKNISLILSLLISISTLAQSKKSLLRDGNKLYVDSSYNEAEIKYRKSLAKDQDYFNASFNLADAIYKQQRYNESSTIFDALKDNTTNEYDLAKIYHNLGNSLVKEQKFEEGINAYKEALRINPNDNDTRHNLALTKKEKEQQENQEKKEEQDQEKEQQENQEKKEEQDQEKKQKENQQENQDKKEPKDNKDEISKKSAEKMLEAIQQQEKDLQKKLQKKKVKGKKTNVLKDW